MDFVILTSISGEPLALTADVLKLLKYVGSVKDLGFKSDSLPDECTVLSFSGTGFSRNFYVVESVTDVVEAIKNFYVSQNKPAPKNWFR